MAGFTFSLNLNSFFPQGLTDKDLALDMVKAGQEVMQRSIKSAAEKHVITGEMAKSVKSSKPVINSQGDAVGRVKFYGKGKDTVDKNGKTQKGVRNWNKAIWLEYGTVHQKATPFIRPAIKSCENEVKSAMQKVFLEKSKGGG